jgi:endogenous inhibitor of DNA gyrase (YacG/DUF329 family)
MSKTVKCPNCGTSVAWLTTNQFKPFCSERCKMLDFGEWIMAEKSIPGEPQTDSLDSDQQF